MPVEKRIDRYQLVIGMVANTNQSGVIHAVRFDGYLFDFPDH